MSLLDLAPEFLKIFGLDDRGIGSLNPDRLRTLIAGKRKQWTIEAADPNKRAEALGLLKELLRLEAQIEGLGGPEGLRQKAASTVPPSTIVSLREGELHSLLKIALAGRPALGSRQRDRFRAEAIERGISSQAVDTFLARLPAADRASAPPDRIPLPLRSPALTPERLRALHEGITPSGKHSLYEFLGLAADSPQNTLVQSAKDWLATQRRVLSSEDLAKVTRSLEGCLKQLGRPDSRREYDNALVNDSVHRFCRLIDLVLAGDPSTQEQVEFLTSLGTRDHGLRSSVVRQCIASRMTENGAMIRWLPQDIIAREGTPQIAERPSAQENKDEDQGPLRERFERAVRRRKLYKAELLLRGNEPAGTLSDSEAGQDLRRRLTQVREELREIDRLSRTPGSQLVVMERYAALLSECTDCPEALQALRTLKPDPPPAPIDLELTLADGHRHLSWKIPETAPAGCLFEVERCCTEPLAAGDDAANVDRRGPSRFESLGAGPDRHRVDLEPMPPGSILSYTVKAVVRGEYRVLGKVVHEFNVSSMPAAPVSILTWKEVEGLRTRTVGEGVMLKFLSPPGARQVVIERWSGGPGDRPEDPAHFSPRSPDLFIDAELAPGTTYTYRAYAVFDGPSGEFRTPGVHATQRTQGRATGVPVESSDAKDLDRSLGGAGGSVPAGSQVVSSVPLARTARPAPASAPKVVERRPTAQRSTRLVWRFPTETPQGRQPLRNCAAVEWGRRIYACLGESVVALTPEGEKVWEYDAGGHIPGSPVLGDDGDLRFHSGDGRLHCLDSEGHRRWEPVRVGEPLGWASPLVDHEGTTWVWASEGGLRKIGRDGTSPRSPYFRSMQRFDSTGVIRDGVLYAGAEDACVYAIDLKGLKGKNLWDPLANEGRTGWFINSALLVDGQGRLIVVSRDDRLYAFDAAGQVVWSFAMPGQLLASPVLDGEGRLYLSLSQSGAEGTRGALACFDVQAQRMRWTSSMDAAVESTPVVGDDGLIYFGDNAGRVHAVDREGRFSWTDELDCPVRSAGTLAAPNRLLFGLDDGSLVALECSSAGLAAGWPKLMKDLAQIPVC